MTIRKRAGTACMQKFCVFLIGGLLFIYGSQAVTATSENNKPGSSQLTKLLPASGKATAQENRRLLVRFKEGVLNSLKTSLHRELDSRIITRSHRSVPGLQVIEAGPGKNIQNVIDRYQRNPNVIYAEPDFRINFKAIPNDNLFTQLWGLNNTGQTGGLVDADINAPEAWDVNTGNSDVVVAIVDTGVDHTHQDLVDNMWVNPGEIAGNGIDDDGNGYIDDIHGMDAGDNDSDPMDTYGHGTHIAGTIGASGNNSLGVAGINWDVSIIACKILSSAPQDIAAFVSDAVQCLDYLYDLKVNRGINIIATNNSWGWLGEPSQTLMDAIERQAEAGILFVAAAGNDSANTDTVPDNPSTYYLPNIISVAASTHTDLPAYFTNYGKRTVHVAAPGEDILSTIPDGSTGGSPPPAQNPHDDIFLDDVESGTGGWSAQPLWGITTISSFSPTSSWTDSPVGDYANNVNSSLTSQVIDLSSYLGQPVFLGFYANAQIETGFDNLYIEVSNDSVNWSTLQTITGTSNGWEFYSITIPPQYLTNTFQFRFRLSTDYIVTMDGVYIDDIGIGTTPYVPGPGAGSNTYGTASGTSMAAPHVVGLAALLKSQFPAYSSSQLRNLIISSGTPLPVLSDNIVSGRRIRAFDTDNTGGLTCANQTVQARLQPTSDMIQIPTGSTLGISMLNVNCAEPAGNVNVTIIETGEIVTLLDNGLGFDQVANDGVYSAEIDLDLLGLQNASIAFPDSTTVYVSTFYVNTPPVANAGSDQIVTEGDLVNLNGSGTDNEGPIINYSWVQIGGDPVNLNNPALPNPSFTAPEVSSPMALIFQLTVTDFDGATDSDQVVVMVTDSAVPNDPPVANAGDDQVVDEGDVVNLNGSGTDNDGSIVAYSWAQVGGPPVILNDSNSQNPSFTAPQVTSNSVVTMELTVTDDRGDTDTDQVVISVNDVPPPNVPPSANAGVDQTVDEGAAVNLNGSGTDSDGTVVSYSWTQVSGDPVSLSASNIPNPGFTAPQVSSTTDLVFELTVTDDDGDTDSDQVTITVNDVPPPNMAPLADAGLAQRVNEGEVVILNGNGSDSDGVIVSYSWNQLSGQAVVVNGADTQNPEFTAPQVDLTEVLVFELTVTDNDGATDTDQVVIMVDDVPPPNIPPVADAGSDQSVEEGDEVTLSGNGTDTDGSITSYSWVQIGGSPVILDNANSPSPTFTAPEVDVDSSMTFQLTVTDSAGQTAQDQVVITVTNVPQPSQSPSNNASSGGGGSGGGGSFGILFALLAQLIGVGRLVNRTRNNQLHN